MAEELHTVLATVGTRLRGLRKQLAAGLEQLAESTGISVSTLSRLGSGNRRPTLELRTGARVSRRSLTACSCCRCILSSLRRLVPP